MDVVRADAGHVEHGHLAELGVSHDDVTVDGERRARPASRSRPDPATTSRAADADSRVRTGAAPAGPGRTPRPGRCHRARRSRDAPPRLGGCPATWQTYPPAVHSKSGWRADPSCSTEETRRIARVSSRSTRRLLSRGMVHENRIRGTDHRTPHDPIAHAANVAPPTSHLDEQGSRRRRTGRRADPDGSFRQARAEQTTGDDRERVGERPCRASIRATCRTALLGWPG